MSTDAAFRQHLTHDEPTLPQGWRWVKLGDTTQVVGGSTPATTIEEYWDGDVVWVTPTDLGQNHSISIIDSARRITQKGLQSCSCEMLPPKTVVMSSRAPIGHLAIAEVELCTNQGCKSFIPLDGLDTEYLYWALTIMMPKIQALGSGATFAEVSKSALEAFEIPLPSLPEQQRIARILNEQMAAVEQARRAAEARLQAIAALPGAYLREVFPQPGEKLPEGWRWFELGKIMLDNGQYGTSQKSNYEKIGYPVLGMYHIHNGSIRWENVSHVDIDSDSYDKYKLQAGDILFNRTNSAELVGKTAVYDRSDAAVFASYVIRFRTIAEVANPHFVAMYINSSSGRKYIEQNMAQAIGQVNISATVMRKMPIPLPSLSQQKEIVEAINRQLKTCNRARQAAQTQLDTINALPATLLRRAFRGEL